MGAFSFRVMSANAPTRRQSGSPQAAWWFGQTAVPLKLAPAEIPPGPDGSPKSVATVRRWSREGVLGIRLRTFASGPRTTCTTREELQRFLAALSAIRGMSA